MQYSPITTSQSNTLAQTAPTIADYERVQHIKEAWHAYKGKLPKSLKVQSDQPDDNVNTNRCAPIVDKGVSFLFGQPLKIEVDDPKMQDFLNVFWGDDDDKMTLLAQLAMNGGVCGEAFLRIIPPINSMKYPRMIALNPQYIRIITLPDDCSLVIAYVIEYPITSTFGQSKRQIIARSDPDGMSEYLQEDDLDDTWTITNYIRTSATTPWIQVGEVEEWPYPFAPIFHCQNLPNPNEVWGTSDLTPDIIEMNRVLNFVQSNTSRVIKFHAHPITYAVGLNSDQPLKIGVDEMLSLPSENSKIEKLAAMENFSGLIQFADTLRSDIDEQSRVPAVALGRATSMPKGSVSGIAIELMFQPLLEKTQQKRRLYGKLIREVSMAACCIIGLLPIEQLEDYHVQLHWTNLLPQDDIQAAQTGLLLLQLGVSQQTVLQRLGFDPEDEAGKIQSRPNGPISVLPPKGMPQQKQMQSQQNEQDQEVP